MTNKKKVLFVCTQNSARSQMAEGLLRYFHGDRYEAYSAGTNPFKVNPFAIKAMANLGIDISSHYSKSFDELANREFDVVVTVCDNAKENCPYFAGGKKYIHHSFSDPAVQKGSDAEILTQFEKVRDEIKLWLDESIENKTL